MILIGERRTSTSNVLMFAPCEMMCHCPSPNSYLVWSAKEPAKRKELKLLAQRDKRQTQLDLYRYSWASLLAELDPVVEQFNQEFQYGQITRHEELGTIYHIPQGHSILLSCFRPPDSPIKIRNGELIGGGWIGLSQGISANLV